MSTLLGSQTLAAAIETLEVGRQQRSGSGSGPRDIARWSASPEPPQTPYCGLGTINGGKSTVLETVYSRINEGIITNETSPTTLPSSLHHHLSHQHLQRLAKTLSKSTVSTTSFPSFHRQITGQPVAHPEVVLHASPNTPYAPQPPSHLYTAGSYDPQMSPSAKSE